MRRHISSRTAVAVLLACGTLVAGAVTTGAVAATHGTHASKTEKESFLLTYGPHETEVVVAHGAFTGGGKVSPGNVSDTLNLGGGSLRINHPDGSSHYHQKLNPTTCFASFTITGTYTLAHGTGKYAGYTGKGSYTVTGGAIAKRSHGGACNQNADPKVEAAYILANGTVSK